MSYRSPLIVIGSLLIISVSCIKEEYDMNKLIVAGQWAPEIAIPLVHSTLGVEDLLEPSSEPSHLSTLPDGLMMLIYKDTLFSQKADSFITFPPGVPIINNYPNSDTIILNVDSIDLNLKVYNKLMGGSFYFENPKMNVIVTNSIGMKLDITLTILDAWSPINGWMNIVLDGTSAPITFTPSPAYPAIPGISAVTTYIYDETNSNIKNFLALAPKYLYYAVKGIINAPPVIFPNFVTDTSRFSVEVEIELPLYGTANFLTIGDTIPFQLGINDPSDTDVVVTSAVFVINTYNGFPVNTRMQLDFVDFNGVIVDSLFYAGQELVMAAAPLGPAPVLRVTGRTHQVTEVAVDKARLDKIATATELIVRGELTTTNNGTALVKIYSDYTIEIKLAVRAKLGLVGK